MPEDVELDPIVFERCNSVAKDYLRDMAAAELRKDILARGMCPRQCIQPPSIRVSYDIALVRFVLMFF
jgi:hypothetical protein